MLLVSVNQISRGFSPKYHKEPNHKGLLLPDLFQVKQLADPAEVFLFKAPLLGGTGDGSEIPRPTTFWMYKTLEITG